MERSFIQRIFEPEHKSWLQLRLEIATILLLSGTYLYGLFETGKYLSAHNSSQTNAASPRRSDLPASPIPGSRNLMDQILNSPKPTISPIPISPEK